MVCGKLLPVYETLMLKGYSPNSSEASFCVSLPVWLVQQGRQRGRCPQGLAKNTYWDTAVPRQSVHLKRAALQTVLKQSIPNERIMFGAVSALRADLTTQRMVFGNLDWGTQPTAGGAGVLICESESSKTTDTHKDNQPILSGLHCTMCIQKGKHETR